MDTTTVEITTLAHGGDGIGRVAGQVCFVPFGLPGDTLKVRVTRKTKNALWAEIEEVLEPSPDRTEALDDRSGAALWGHFAYPAQAAWKQRLVREALQRFGGIEVAPGWIEDASLRTGYRTRAEFHGDGEKLGFYAHGSHDIVDIQSHPLLHEKLNAALPKLHEAKIKGSVTVTVNPEGEEVLVWTRFPKRKLKALFPLANTDDEEGRSWFMFDGVPIVNGTFAQSSLLLNRLLVKETHRQVGRPTRLLDCYCGNGNLSLGLPGSVDVQGLDHNREAVQAARRGKRGEYRAGDESAMARSLRTESWDCILLDPPRTGAKTLAPALRDCGARSIVYVSCDPVTLGRDLKVICESGAWRLTDATALDLFPHTPHVETVCRLERGG